AAATFAQGTREAAAGITFLAPGLRFFHQGQFEGRLKRISAHLCRAPDETVNAPLKKFYYRLLEIFQRQILLSGQWGLLECAPAWDGNRWCDDFIAYSWQGSDGARLLVSVNFATHPSQCYVRLPFLDLEAKQWRLKDLLSRAEYDRDGTGLQSQGLY